MNRWGAPVLAAAVVGAYVGLFHRFGVFDFADEGTQLVQAWRVALGQRPYLDFHTGYGPLYFALQGALMRWGGIGAIRGALLVTQAACGGLLFIATRRLAGSAWAWLAIALQIAFLLPIAPSQGAPFNVPYPAWYAELLGLVIAVVLSGGGAIGSGAAFVAGVAAGLTCAIKINSGVLFGAGAAAVLALGHGAGRASVAGAVLLGAMVVGIGAMLGGAVLGAAGAVLLLPAVALAGLGRQRQSVGAAPLLAFVAGGFVVTASFLLPLWIALGPARFAREVLLIGAGVADVYGVPLPAGIVVGTTVGIIAAIRPLVPRALAVAAGVFVLIGVAVMGARDAERPAVALRLASDAVLFAATALSVWAALRRLATDAPRALLAPTVLAVVGLVQLFPRPDGLHLLSIAPLAVPLAMYVCAFITREWSRPLQRATLAVGLLICGVRSLSALQTAAGPHEPMVVGDETLWAAPAGAQRLQSLRTAVTALTTRTAASQPVFSFPACAAVTFFAHRPPLGIHDYFFPGRPTADEVAAMVTAWDAAPPPVVVTCSAEGTDLAQAWWAYPEMTRWLTTRYRPVLVAGSFTIAEVAR